MNTLGMCANPSDEQLKAEKPTMQRPTRALQKRFGGPKKNNDVVKVIPPLTHSQTCMHVCSHPSMHVHV